MEELLENYNTYKKMIDENERAIKRLKQEQENKQDSCSTMNLNGMPHCTSINAPFENRLIKEIDNISLLEKELIELIWKFNTVEKALSRLNDNDYDLIALHYLAKYTFKEIAYRKNKKESCITKQIHKIVRKMK